MSTPTLIDLPPPSDTPSDMGPGTPNSGTTSLSALSTTAIKDGHQGNRHAHSRRHAHRSSSASDTSTTTLDAERADRISRLAGLERVATTRPGNNGQGGGNLQGTTPSSQPPPAYFDTVHSQLLKERSTVGSASATGSVGGRTTWASGSDLFDTDRATEDPDDGGSSAGALSDEGNSSIVGFGEGAGSTVSGPVSTAALRSSAAARHAAGGAPSPSTNRPAGNVFPPQLQPYAGGVDSGIIPPSSTSPAGSNTPEPPLSADGDDARMVDGMTYDSDVVDTAARPPPLVARGSSGTGSSGA